MTEDPGSSPLTRGKRPVNYARPHFTGLIPAHAGKTACGICHIRDTGAHPRSRGENRSYSHSASAALGSSPLTRGKRGASGDVLEVEGLIPAHAGKTGDFSEVKAGNRAHPRSRGENTSWLIRLFHDGGSSPLTRGKPAAKFPELNGLGLIPAHAGKTPCSRDRPGGAQAHPRSRGENRPGQRGVLHRVGSSPLTRGKPWPARYGHRGSGLIPAHAGKTGRQPHARRRLAAHPRSRGENPPLSAT